MSKTITITIGDNEVTWHVMETDAPSDYDGFGTFTIADYGDSRTVLIRSEHQIWQTMRYSSGNHWSKPTEHDMDNVADLLWKRLQGRQP